MNGQYQQQSRPIVAGLLAALNLLVAALAGYMLNEIKETKRELHVAVERLEERNHAQDDLANQIRMNGFERLGKVETLLEEHQRRIDEIDARLNGKRKPEFPEHGGLDGVSPGAP